MSCTRGNGLQKRAAHPPTRRRRRLALASSTSLHTSYPSLRLNIILRRREESPQDARDGKRVRCFSSTYLYRSPIVTLFISFPFPFLSFRFVLFHFISFYCIRLIYKTRRTVNGMFTSYSFFRREELESEKISSGLGHGRTCQRAIIDDTH